MPEDVRLYSAEAQLLAGGRRLALHLLRTALQELEASSGTSVRAEAANHRDGEVQEARRHIRVHEVAARRQRPSGGEDRGRAAGDSGWRD